VNKPKINERVWGPDGPGVVTDVCDGTHDVAVKCDDGTIALYCQDRTCREYQPVYVMAQAQAPSVHSAMGADALLAKYDQVYAIAFDNGLAYPEQLNKWLAEVRAYNARRHT